MMAGFAPAVSLAAEPLPRSVLIVAQWDPGVPFLAALSDAFHATLRATSEPISVYSEALDLSRFHNPQHQENFRRYLREKYHEKNLSVIVAVGPLALEFMLQAGADISPTASLIFSAVDESTIAKLKLSANVTGTTAHLTLHDMLAAAQAIVSKLQAQPPTTNTGIKK
jgi:hypothetical protein